MKSIVKYSYAIFYSLLIAGDRQGSSSIPIVPLTPGGLLIPFQPSKKPDMKLGPLPRQGGYPSMLKNFNDIRQQRIDNHIPSSTVLTAGSSSLMTRPQAPYAPDNSIASLNDPTRDRSIASAQTNPYRYFS
jgi:hypothetical protein